MRTTASPKRQYRGSHRRCAPEPVTLPAPPDDQEKYRYAERHLPYLTVVLAFCFLAATASQIWFETQPYMWPFGIFTAVCLLAFGVTLPLSFTGRGFDWPAHEQRVRAWRPGRYPDVDIYLPICGEPPGVLRNTWSAVFELCHAYPGLARAYVLDDGADPAARRLAADFGFTYVVRPDAGRHKKSGNLRYAFARTSGDFFVVLDADFAPRSDLLAETLPYFDDQDIAIVQTPQYFRTCGDQTWVERGAGAIQEIFYRAIQVSRDRLDATICVGTCAVYRSAALAIEGGPTLVEYAEDVHTGLDARRNGWRVIYVPVLLATGMCPSDLNMFIRQQYRWCLGATSTVLTSRLWTVRMSVRARLSYLCGLAYYAQTALSVFVIPLMPICLMALRPGVIRAANAQFVIAAILAAIALVPVWNISTYRVRDVLPLMEARSWGHALAFWDWLRGKTMAWQPTGGQVTQVRRFRIGLICWDGSVALAWLALAGWRSVEFRTWQFVVICGVGAIYAASVCRLLRAVTKAGS
jgi:cellulose synthase (UDP-forming)